MNKIEIFPAEIEAGLEKSVANNIIDYCTELKMVTLPELAIARASVEVKDVGLYRVPSVLASVGWNKNTDVFTPEDLFNARSTPVNKPFNYMHKESDIIGHTVASYVFTHGGTLWTESTCPDEPFDIIDDSVIYTIYESPENIERIQKLIAEIQDGAWFVSMECVFPNFDYAIKDKDNSEEIITRNASTAFLTKYLKVYGGTGQFEGKSIGRVLRNFVFSGKGLVDKPANERSIILTKSQYNNESGEVMEIKELETKLSETTKNHEVAVASLAVLTEEKLELTKSNEDLSTEITALQESVAALTKEVASLQETLAAKASEVATLQEELSSSKAEILKTSRAMKLVKAGLEDRAEELLTKFSSVSEEIFDEFVALAKKEMPWDKKKDEKAEENMDKTKCEESDAIDTVEVPVEASLATAGLADNDSELFSSVASWVQNNIIPSKKASK